MSSGLFSIARTALLTHQTALQTISHNVANAETPGYSRQEAVLTANTPIRLANGSVGTGVSMTTIARKRDVLLDDAFRSASTIAGDAGMRRDLLGRLEAVFGEPTDAGMANALDQFWNAWSDLSVSPGPIARSMVQQRGRQLAQLFNEYDAQITAVRDTAFGRLNQAVERINVLAAQVAELNGRIGVMDGSGPPANDLRDLRDMKLDELAKLAGARTVPQSNGSLLVMVGNDVLIEGGTATPLSARLERPDPAPATPLVDLPISIRLGESREGLKPLAGELAALVDVLNVEIPDARSRLDTLAAEIVQEVNTLHRGGFTFSGNTIPGTAAGDFFNPGSAASPVSAASITLSAAIAADPAKIAASGDANGPTDNSVAVRISSLRSLEGTVSWTNASGVTESGSFLGFFRGLVARLGVGTSVATDNATVADVLVAQADQRRQSVNGVNTDEELVNMLRVQQSYQAATKMIKAAEEMLDTLLSLV